MTTQELITEMRGKLNNERLCRSDFENYDVPNIEHCTEPFFWKVREYGTILIHIGPTHIISYLKNELYRMELHRDILTPINSLLYWCNQEHNEKIYYWNGNALCEVDVDEVKSIYLRTWKKAIERELKTFPKEAEVYDKPLSLVFTEEAEKRREECEKLERELKNNTFTQCLNQLSSWTRCAVNHRIIISLDFCDHSFFFREMVNDTTRTCGGIIFQDSKWQIHT